MNYNIFSKNHPIWLAGFRPFFILAMIMGLILPLVWGLIFSSQLTLPKMLSPIPWHAHEMFFGFGGAVLFGFLLTASKNWVGVRGVHGTELMFFVALWTLERISVYFLGDLSPFIKHLAVSLFVICTGLYIVWTLIKFRKNDSFPDNFFFIFLLIVLVIAKNLMVSEEYYRQGIAMTLGLFRLAFLVMFERTMTQFMKNTMNVTLYRNIILDYAIKILAAVLVFQSFMNSAFSVLFLSLLSLLLFIRWILWRPDLGFRKFSNATMYLGYLALNLHLVFEALQVQNVWSFGAYSIHIFTFLCMGIVIPSMLVRISNGHTGRKPNFSGWPKLAISIIGLSAIFRLILPLYFSQYYTTWILVAGLMWSTGFFLLLYQLTPFLLQSRIDGKVH